MLYVTTRDKHDAFTASRVLRDDYGPDGGLYLPFQMPVFTREELSDLNDKSFGQCVAEILNLFFSCRLSGWDVELRVGKYPVKLKDIRHRILVAELWHNQDWNYSRLEDTLSRMLREQNEETNTTSWLRIAIRISVLFGLYGEMLRGGAVEAGMLFDVTLPTCDFSAVMAVWYARQMGLPVANIICSCNENSAVWDLLHLGEVRTDVSAVKTTTPEADIGLPKELERMISAALGPEEAKRYCDIRDKGGIYTPRPGTLETLRKGVFAAVVSAERLNAVIPSVYHTCGYIMGPYCALGYSGLLDYRAKNGEGRLALLLSDRNPVCDRTMVAAAMNVSQQELTDMLNIF